MNTSFISTQQIKDLINEQKFTSTQEIMNCMKNMFADILEQTLQAEMDQHLGYEHAERRNDDAKKNYRNGSVKRTMKTQLGEVEVNVPRDRNGRIRTKDHLKVSAQCRWYRGTYPVPLCCRHVYP